MILPIVVSQNCSAATSGAMLAPINTQQSIPKMLSIRLDIIAILPLVSGSKSKPWNKTSSLKCVTEGDEYYVCNYVY